jgi:Na+/H+-dicarboxylate symporter
MRNSTKLSAAVAIAMVAGVCTGAVLRSSPGSAVTTLANAALPVLPDLFLRLIKMTLAPLILVTLTSGIAHLESTANLGRLGIRAMLWFVLASLVALTLGAVSATLFQPGAGFHLAIPVSGGGNANVPAAQSLLLEIVPLSIFQALSTNSIVQIVFFSLFAGGALLSVGPDAKVVVRLLDALSMAMLKVISFVMVVAPLAVFASMTLIVLAHGVDVLSVYARFLGIFYATLGVFWICLLLAGRIFAKQPFHAILLGLREPLLIGFSTASSEAAFGPTLKALSRMGVPDRIARFVIALGYSFNLGGGMVFCTFGSLFIAQVYGVKLSIGELIAMIGTFFITSKGIAGVPRASIVVLAATMPRFGIPEAGILLLIGVDHFLDMGRTATNVLGNAIAALGITPREHGTPAGPDYTI